MLRRAGGQEMNGPKRAFLRYYITFRFWLSTTWLRLAKALWPFEGFKEGFEEVLEERLAAK